MGPQPAVRGPRSKAVARAGDAVAVRGPRSEADARAGDAVAADGEARLTPDHWRGTPRRVARRWSWSTSPLSRASPLSNSQPISRASPLSTSQPSTRGPALKE